MVSKSDLDVGPEGDPSGDGSQIEMTSDKELVGIGADASPDATLRPCCCWDESGSHQRNRHDKKLNVCGSSFGVHANLELQQSYQTCQILYDD